ncbi:MAG TPA: hypothetical protein VJB12_05820 [Candidatus Nanoarchaeia archaeon]|nr:hypothetical protein [Candidatus Nanoarchaeia archaeon]
MMQTRDWVSGLVGLIVFLLGLFPFLASFGRGPDWWGFSLPIAIAGWIVAIGGFYLLMNSFIEITNSNIVGWVSLCVAGIISLLGVLHVFGSIGKFSGFLAVQWIPSLLFHIIFMVLGLFLMIATVAMEL